MEFNGRDKELTSEIINAAIEVHRTLGAGLLESLYQKALVHELRLRDLNTVVESPVRISYKDITFDENLRVDLIVENKVILELKSVEEIHPAHKAQLLSYMKLLQIPIGLIINFHEPMLKDGIRRLVLK